MRDFQATATQIPLSELIVSTQGDVTAVPHAAGNIGSNITVTY